MSSHEFPIVLVKNLPFNLQSDTLYQIFGKFGNIHQIRIPDISKSNENANDVRGSCIIIYNNYEVAMRAAKELNGVNLQGRYIVASILGIDKSKLSTEDFINRKEELEKLKLQYDIQ